MYYPLLFHFPSLKVHDNVSLGVLRCGYAETQEEYDEAFKNVFAELDDLDLKLSTSRYIPRKKYPRKQTD